MTTVASDIWSGLTREAMTPPSAPHLSPTPAKQPSQLSWHTPMKVTNESYISVAATCAGSLLACISWTRLAWKIVLWLSKISISNSVIITSAVLHLQRYCRMAHKSVQSGGITDPMCCCVSISVILWMFCSVSSVSKCVYWNCSQIANIHMEKKQCEYIIFTKIEEQLIDKLDGDAGPKLKANYW